MASHFDKQPSKWKGSFQTSGLLIAWKRIYLEYDPMYKRGTTVTENFTPDANDDDDVLTVDSTQDLEEGAAVTIFTPDGTTRNRVIILKDDQNSTVTIADLDIGFIAYKGGIKLQNSDETYEVSTAFLGQAFGNAADGSDGGAFVEFSSLAQGSSPVPKMLVLRSRINLEQFSARWKSAQINAFQIIACYELQGLGGGVISGISQPAGNSIAVSTTVGAGDATWIKEVMVHEAGHQWSPDNGHEDGTIAVPDHAGVPSCIMSYADNFRDGKTEFDILCIDSIRNHRDGI